MKKFELMYIPNEGTITVIPTTAKMCIKLMKASADIDKIRDKLNEIPVEPAYFEGNYGPMHAMNEVQERLNRIDDLITTFINTLEDENDDEED